MDPGDWIKLGAVLVAMFGGLLGAFVQLGRLTQRIDRTVDDVSELKAMREDISALKAGQAAMAMDMKNQGRSLCVLTDDIKTLMKLRMGGP